MRIFLTGLWILLILVNITAGAVNPTRAAVPAPAAGQGTFTRFVIVPAESEVVYRVGETIINENNRFNIAVGTTNATRGEIFIDRSTPANSRIGMITVDISQFKSDSQRRDNAIRRQWLESTRFPFAEFTPTSIQGLPQTYLEDQEVTVQVIGTLRIREVAKPTPFATKLRLRGDTLTGVATTTLLMTDFGFDPPSIFGILRAENDVKLEFRFTAHRV